MNSGKLDKEMISQPELWRLALIVSADRLDVALYPPLTREEIIWRSFAFDPDAPSQLRAIEDIIYANPLLLSDFKRVDCIIDNAVALPLPAALTPADAETVYRAATADAPADADIELYPTADCLTAIALMQQPDISAFFRRTFYNVRFDSRMAALARFFINRSDAPAGPMVYAISRSRRLTLIAVSGQRLLMANNFTFQADADAAYYILASMQTLGLDPLATPLALNADSAETRAGIAGMLKPYVTEITSIPLPALRYRATKATFEAPIDLLIRPLCE